MPQDKFRLFNMRFAIYAPIEYTDTEAENLSEKLLEINEKIHEALKNAVKEIDKNLTIVDEM